MQYEHTIEKEMKEGGIMQAKLSIRCGTCDVYLGDVRVDTADMPEGATGEGL